MKIERFEINGLAQYSYVVSDGGEAAVIDARRDVSEYVEYARQHSVRITHILETHIHADFAAGSLALAAATGAELDLSGYDRGEHFVYAMPHKVLRDGDAVRVGGVRLQAMHTPGHTPEHLAFLLFEGDASEPVAMFSGDFVFVGSLGRPDLLGEAAKIGLAHLLYASVQRVKLLPDAVEIYPGHGAGSLCGAGMHEGSESSIEFERAHNPYFGFGEVEFVEKILASVPAMPDYYPRMKALNAQGAAAIELLPTLDVVEPEVFDALRKEADVRVIDLRPAGAFGAGHVPGAISLGADGSLALWAGWLLDAEARLLLVSEGGDDEASRMELARVGLDRVWGYLDGGMQAWVDAGLEVERTRLITAEELEAEGDVLIVDVRNDSEWKEGSIAGAKHIPLGVLARSVGQLDKSVPIVMVCAGGYRASAAASLLQREGFENVSSLSGGMEAWRRKSVEAL